MVAFLGKLRRILRSRRGTAALEYAVMGGGLVFLIAIAGEMMGTALSDAYGRVACTISSNCPAPTATPPSPPPPAPRGDDD